MFSTTGLFKNISCPSAEKCALINCIFSHQLADQVQDKTVNKAHNGITVTAEGFGDRPVVKKRKLDTDEELTRVSNSTKGDTGTSFNIKLDNGKTNDGRTTNSHSEVKSPLKDLESLHRDVSPPPKPLAKPQAARAKVESLNPRTIPSAPAGHDKRTLYVKHMHDGMKRLNTEIGQSADVKMIVFKLDEHELIKAALDEEEQIARGNPSVYANIMKLSLIHI